MASILRQYVGGGGGGGALGCGPTGSSPIPVVPPITHGLSPSSLAAALEEPASPYAVATCPLPGATIGSGMEYPVVVVIPIPMDDIPFEGGGILLLPLLMEGIPPMRRASASLASCADGIVFTGVDAARASRAEKRS